MGLRVLIADDDADMRMMMKKALAKIPGIELVGEAENGEQAVELEEKLRPDCVFIDIEMPVMNGVEAAVKMIDIDPKLKIVFITAFADYMPQAFELYIFDYMVKPYKFERLLETINRIKALKHEPAAKKPEKISFNTKDGVVFLDPDEIFIVQRENRSTVIILQNSRHIVSETMSEIEEILPKNIFIRSHKSYVINFKRISRMYPYGRWTYVAEFAGLKDDALVTSEKEKEIVKRIGL